MLFNSFAFLLFLPIVFLLYWYVFSRSIRLRNLFVVSVSYLFYGWWDWRFLSLIAFTTLCSWLSGLLIRKKRSVCDMGDTVSDHYCRGVMIINIVLNLAILAYFKYANFFIDNFIDLFGLFGITLHRSSLNVVLPVGISFYTFQALSYTIDVYRRKMEPTSDILAFFAFVSFFPQLVAGPIERASHLLPQFCESRHFCYKEAVDGLRQILWGLFKKVVVADNCAIVANAVFLNMESATPSSLLLGAIMFSFQIYGDFSGYSDIAVGTAHLFNFDLVRNFNVPYFSRSIAEFWRRWHISLNTWFVDYVYIPLGGNRRGKWQTLRNTLAVFFVGGLWHGANWTYIMWGIYHGLLFLPLLLLGKTKQHIDVVAKGRWMPSVRELLQMISTFCLAMWGWVVFRSPNLIFAFDYLKRMCSLSVFNVPNTLMLGLGNSIVLGCFLFVFILLFVEWIQREKKHGLDIDWIRSPLLRLGVYCGFAWLILFFMGVQESFIYFQF